MEQNFWTILITYSTVQCFIIVAILLIGTKGNRAQKKWLAVILVVIGLLSLNFLYEYFQWYAHIPHLIWVATPLWFLLGPALYFFSRNAVHKNGKWHLYDYLHLFPFIVAVVYIGRFYLLRGESKISTLEYFYQTYGSEPDYFLYAFLSSLLIYSAYSLYLFNRYFWEVGKEYSDTLIYQMKWIRILLAGFLVFFALSLGYNFLLLYDYEYYIQVDYLTYLVLSLFIQALGFAAILKPDAFFATPVNFNRNKAENAKSDEDLKALFSQVKNYMENEKPYVNPELRLSDLSYKINIPAHKLSQIINTVANQNFFEFVNSYRVREVKRRLHKTEFEHLSLEGIAKECGFNSSASFYRVFKQHTRMTPGQFIQQQGLQ